ncbi:MAG: hypothetical protein AAGK32_12385 [Actinomycetota bacterium]
MAPGHRVDAFIATPDPPPKGVPNPIHDAEGADAAGYAGALVAGVRTYGWAAQTVVAAIGERWLRDGWADFSLRRPLFAGEELTVTVAPSPDGGEWSMQGVGRGQGGERVVIDGTVGLGRAGWFDDLRPPDPAPGLDPPEVRPGYSLDTVPLETPLRPLSAWVRAEAARALATGDLGLTDQRYGPDADPVPLHPYFLAARMAPLTRHNFTYGPTIHVRSQIQHVAEGEAGAEITVGARIVDAYARNDHWYQVLDGAVTAGTTSNDPGRTLAVLRHHTIFRPRGT